MSVLLDTDTCVGLIRRTLPGTQARIRLMHPKEIRLCSIVRFELEFGIRSCARPQQEAFKLNQFWSMFDSVSFDNECATSAALIRKRLESRGETIGPYDTLIAAIALRHRLTLVSRNIREFKRVDGLTIEDWEA